MKIAAVLGSPHGMKQATGSILTSLLEGAKSAGAETEDVKTADIALPGMPGLR